MLKPGADGEWARQQVGVPSTFKNRPSHHKYKSPKQFKTELKGSKSA